MVVMRSGWSRQGGFELFLTDGSRGQELWDLAFAAGAYGSPRTPTRWNASRTACCRIAPTPTTTPIRSKPASASGATWTPVTLSASPIIARHEDPDARKLLVNVHIDGDMPASRTRGRPPSPVSRRRAPRGVWSPKLERNIGLALVPVRHAVPGTMLDVDAEGVALTMTVTDILFGDSL